jgi:hypothetical protein
MAKKKLIVDEEYPSNSRANRSAPIREEDEQEIMEEGANIVPEKRVRRRSKARGVVKKKSWAQSIAEAFVGHDSPGVGSYILNDVLIPAAKSTILEMVQSGIEMFLFGETRSRGRSRDKDRSIVSYGSYYKSRDRDERPERKRPTYRDKFDLSEIYFRDHSDAEDVLSELCDLLEKYEQVSVADFFDLAEIDGATWAHTKWGWTSLKRAYCTHTRNGYAIVFPDPVELD